ATATACGQGADERAEDAEAASDEDAGVDAAAQERDRVELRRAEDAPRARQARANQPGDVPVLDGADRLLTEPEARIHDRLGERVCGSLLLLDDAPSLGQAAAVALLLAFAAPLE